MFLARFCNHQYSQSKGVAANHVPPTRDCHVTHQVRLYEFVTSRKISIRPAPFSFILRYDTRCYFNVRSKADISQLNLPHGTDN